MLQELAAHEIEVTKLGPEGDAVASVTQSMSHLLQTKESSEPPDASSALPPQEALMELLQWANESDSDEESGEASLISGFCRVYELLNAWWTPLAWRAWRDTSGLGWTQHHSAALDMLNGPVQEACLALGRPKEVGRRQLRVLLESLDCGGVKVPSFNSAEKGMLARALLQFAVDAEKDPRTFLAPVEDQLEASDVDNHEALVELLLSRPVELYPEPDDSFRIKKAEEAALCGKCDEDEGNDSDGSVDDDEYRRMLEEAPEDRSVEFLHGTPDGSEASARDDRGEQDIDDIDDNDGTTDASLSIPAWCEEVD